MDFDHNHNPDVGVLMYVSLNGTCHDGTEGAHLQTDTCPVGCTSIPHTQFTGSTVEEKQATVDALTGEAPLTVVIESVGLLEYVSEYRG